MCVCVYVCVCVCVYNIGVRIIWFACFQVSFLETWKQTQFQICTVLSTLLFNKEYSTAKILCCCYFSFREAE